MCLCVYLCEWVSGWVWVHCVGCSVFKCVCVCMCKFVVQYVGMHCVDDCSFVVALYRCKGLRGCVGLWCSVHAGLWCSVWECTVSMIVVLWWHCVGVRGHGGA